MATNSSKVHFKLRQEVFCRLWLLKAGISASNAARQLLLIAVSQIVLYCVKRSKNAGKQESDTDISPVLSKGGGGAFFITVLWVISWFIKIELKQILLQLLAQQENSEWFSIISVIILRSILLLNRNKNIGNDLLVFYKFPFPSTFILLPLPYRFSGCLKRSMSEKEAMLPTKRIFWNHCSL